MQPLESLIIVAMAALVHASFQLSVSMLTLLSSHTIGAKHSHRRLLRLSGSFTLGVVVMTLFMLSTIALFAQKLLKSTDMMFAWIAVCGLLFGLGVAVWIFYYRREQGTTLWIPRPLALFLAERTKQTKQAAEAFSLGLTSVIAEFLFIVPPMLVSALVLLSLPALWQLGGILLYVLISLSSLLIVHMLIGGGHRISRIQQWREEHKRFLQFAAGSGLLILGFYVYVDRVLSPAVMSAAMGVM